MSILPNIILICETWLDEYNTLGNYVCEKYDILRKDRNRYGGGVMILVDKSFYSSSVDFQIDDKVFIECLFCEINFKNTKIIIGCVYRPPNTDVQYCDQMINIINKICVQFPSHSIIIAGDFNLPFIDWSVPQPLKNEIITVKFVNFILENSLEQLVNFPTRGSNTLDLVLCRYVSIANDICTVPPIVSSDHEYIHFSMVVDYVNKKLLGELNKNKYAYCFERADFNCIAAYLGSVNWIREFSYLQSVDEWYSCFLNHMHKSIELFVPSRKIDVNNNRHIPKRIKRLLSKKKIIWRKMKLTNSPDMKVKFKEICNICKQELRAYHRKKIDFVCKQKNTKHFYNFINKRLGRITSPITLKSPAGNILSCSESAETFANYFHSVYNTDNGSLPVFENKCDSKLYGIDFSMDIISSYMHKLSNKTSVGPDGIPNLFLKKMSGVLSLPLSLIFQRSLDSGVLPRIWKVANITPVFKGAGSRFNRDNYRPISLTSNVCKLMESIIYDNIYSHCSECKLFSNVQHGFRKSMSTATNLLEMNNDITKLLDEGNCVDLITIDFSKAFDKISHSKLLHKLDKYGICSNVHNWINSFLKNRSFRVSVGDCFSKSYDIPSSVPQGSKLGPLMFLLYVNDISDLFKYAKIKMYADDLSIYAPVNNENDNMALQNELDKLCKWCAIWSLSINYKKCNLIHMGYNNPNLPYHLNDTLLSVSNCERILGVLVDDNLSFSDHIYSCVKKANRISNLILANVYNLENSLLIDLYKTYCRPYLDYVSTVYSPHYLQLIDVIESVQRHFTKRLHGLKNMSYIERMQMFNLESLELRRLRTDLILLYKILHGYINTSLYGEFVYNRVRETRGHTFKLVKNHVRLDVRKFSFTCRVIDVWNSLNSEVVSSSNVKQFIHKLSLYDLSKFIRGRAIK